MSNEKDDQYLFERDCDAAVIRDLATGLGEINKAADNAAPFVVLADGYKVHDLEKTLPRPLAVRSQPSFSTLDGLIGYVDGFKGNDTAIFVDPADGTTVAIIDYHGRPGDTATKVGWPSWCTHRPYHRPTKTVEWERWMQNNDRWQDQRSFAEFLENNVADITLPPGADMLEIALTLEAKTAVAFKSGIRLENGSTQLNFTSEEVSKAGTNGNLAIPNTFTLALAPFRGGEMYPLVARFRYKIAEGKLTLRYQLVNPHKVIEAAVGQMIERIKTGTAIAPYLGVPGQ